MEKVMEMVMASLRSVVAVVPQDTALFNDTIFNNIAYSRASARTEEVIQAAKQARIHDAVVRMPDGYNTMVGERGLKVSIGGKVVCSYKYVVDFLVIFMNG
ncbi:hypothetical protein O6H91_Y523700 [Diphasiastrum complanatum]|nr:hypothetical protein O6H91_Y523700 [Diphasiastrum complanatum]